MVVIVVIVEMPEDKSGVTPSACPPGGCSGGMPMM